MAFNIRMGLPEMEAFWNDLSTRRQQGKLDKEGEKFLKKLVSYFARFQKITGICCSGSRHSLSHERLI